MDNADLWALIISVLVPHLVAIISRATWPWYLTAILAVLVAAGVGTGSAYFAGQFGGVDTVQAVLIAISATLGSYEAIWKNSSLLGHFLNDVNGGPTVSPASPSSTPI